MIQDKIDRIEYVRIHLMSLQDFMCEMTLQRGESKIILAIVLQNKSHKAIAQSANAVVKNDRI